MPQGHETDENNFYGEPSALGWWGHLLGSRPSEVSMGRWKEEEG